MENNNQELNNQVNTNNNQQVQPNNNKMLIILMALIIVGLAGYIVYAKFIQKGDNPEPKPTNTEENGNKENNPVDNTENYENKIMQGEYDQYGVIYLKGYADVKTYTEKYEGSAKEDKYDLVSFHITDMLGAKSEEEIASWVNHDENDKIYVRLGCVENGIITFNSVADEWYDSSLEGTDGNYWKTLSLSKEESSKIISSNVNSPVTLKLEKLKFSYGGREGNSCTTSISGVEVVK